MSVSVLKEKAKQKTPASFLVRRLDYEFADERHTNTLGCCMAVSQRLLWTQ